MSDSTPVQRSASASTSVPGTGRTEPSRPSSPSTPTPSRHAVGNEVGLRDHQRERDRELEARAGLAHVAGREVDRDALEREVHARRQQRGAHPFARLAAGGVGQSDDVVAGQPVADVDLDPDGLTVDAEQRRAGDRGEHDGPPEPMRTERRAGGPRRLDGVDAAPQPNQRVGQRTDRTGWRRCVRSIGRSARAVIWRGCPGMSTGTSPPSRRPARTPCEAYERDVRQFVGLGRTRWLRRTPRTSTTRRCAATSRSSRRSGLAKRTIARKAAALRSFLRYLKRRGVLVDRLRAARCGRRRVRPACPSASPQLHRGRRRCLDRGRAGDDRRRRCGPGRPGPLALQDLAVLEVLYGTGLRVSECCGLDPGDCRPAPADRSPCSARDPRSAGSRSAIRPLDALRSWLQRGPPERRSARFAHRTRSS